MVCACWRVHHHLHHYWRRRRRRPFGTRRRRRVVCRHVLVRWYHALYCNDRHRRLLCFGFAVCRRQRRRRCCNLYKHRRDCSRRRRRWRRQDRQRRRWRRARRLGWYWFQRPNGHRRWRRLSGGRGCGRRRQLYGEHGGCGEEWRCRRQIWLIRDNPRRNGLGCRRRIRSLLTGRRRRRRRLVRWRRRRCGSIARCWRRWLLLHQFIVV